LTPGLWAQELITGTELDLNIKTEYNRTFYQCKSFSAVYSVDFINRYTLSGGINFWGTKGLFEVDTRIDGEAAVLSRFPLYVNLAYIYNGMPNYDANTHTILPVIAIKGQRAGISLGPSFRFTAFYDDPVLFESILAFLIYVNFYNTGKLRIGMQCANYSDFIAGNFGAYFLNLNSTVRVTKVLSVNSELEFDQSGSVGLAANFYGIAFKAGVTLTW
jgi:hypothetical protein